MIVEAADARRTAPPGEDEPEPAADYAAEGASVAEIDDPDVLTLVRDDPHVLRLESGEILFAEGDPSSCMYVVKSGSLRIRSGSVVYEDVTPGGIVGEMGLVEQHQPRSAMVYALTDSELIEIDDTRFFALVAETPRFALTVMRVLSRRLRAMDRRYRHEPWA
jgi:CRP/FNR family cyclic AMP-dependent transcriptional regulator